MRKMLISQLENEWDLENGFLGGIRQGVYKQQEYERLVILLEGIDLSTGRKLDRRLVSLIWYMPLFLEWQKEKFIENEEIYSKLNIAASKIENIIENILGIP